MYKKRGNDIRDETSGASVKHKKQAPVPYKNPKKRKKSIDEGSTLTPLAPTFRREDLERLEKEHEQILAESDAPEVSDDSSESEKAENASSRGDMRAANDEDAVENNSDGASDTKADKQISADTESDEA